MKLQKWAMWYCKALTLWQNGVTAMSTSIRLNCMDMIINQVFYLTNKTFNLTVNNENYIETVLVVKVLSIEGSN